MPFFFSTWQEPITPQLHTNLPSWKKIGGLHTPLARLTFVNAYLESPGPAICWSFQPKRCWSSCYGSDCHDARAVLPQPIQHVSPFFGKDRDDCFGGGGPPQSCFEQKGFIICQKEFWYTEPCWKETGYRNPTHWSCRATVFATQFHPSRTVSTTQFSKLYQSWFKGGKHVNTVLSCTSWHSENACYIYIYSWLCDNLTWFFLWPTTVLVLIQLATGGPLRMAELWVRSRFVRDTQGDRGPGGLSSSIIQLYTVLEEKIVDGLMNMFMMFSNLLTLMFLIKQIHWGYCMRTCNPLFVSWSRW